MTTATHPLHIDELTPPGTNGTLGLTLCPARDGDLDVVRAWRPGIALGLLEDREYALLGAPHFKVDAVGADLPWLFAEIRDGGVPDVVFERAWKTLGPRVRRLLRDGGRVLLCCRTGLGRTGLVAATVLVELGTEPQAAIDAVRAARPGTIETAEQETYVRSRSAVAAGA